MSYTVNEKNINQRTEGTYGSIQKDDYTATGLIEYEYAHPTLGEYCRIKRDPSKPNFWIIRDRDNQPIQGCEGTFSDKTVAQRMWNNFVYNRRNRKPAEEIT